MEWSEMISRYVVVPAIPTETTPTQHDGRNYCRTLSSGFDIYDNLEKCRLRPSYTTRSEAEAACSENNETPLDNR